MTNGIILRKFDNQIEIIENVLKKYLYSKENLREARIKESKELHVQDQPKKDPFQPKKDPLQPKEVLRPKQIYQIKDVPEIELINTVITQHSTSLSSICILRDKRLVSSSFDGSIIAYDFSYQPQVHIKKAHENLIFSLCGLRNTFLASSSVNEIKIWRIGMNNFQLLHTLNEHTAAVLKVIELKKGIICSSSSDKTIKIWDNGYKCIKTLKGHSGSVISVIEIEDFIVSACFSEKTLIIWDKSTCKSFQYIKHVECCSQNALSQLKDYLLLVGGQNKIYVVNILNFEVSKLEDDSIGFVRCFNVLDNGKALFGNSIGEICCYDSSSNQITFRKDFHQGEITCLIKAEDNKIMSSSGDLTINVYKEKGDMNLFESKKNIKF